MGLMHSVSEKTVWALCLQHLLKKKTPKKQFYKVVIGCIIGEAQTMIEKGHFKARRPKAIQIIIIIATCLIALNTFLVPDLKWPQL